MVEDAITEAEKFAAAVREVQAAINRLPKGRERTRLQGELDEGTRIFREPPVQAAKPRDHWTREMWVVEAERQKSLMRTWARAGREREAGRCAAAAERAEKAVLSFSR
jgi:hypothetical protein